MDHFFHGRVYQTNFPRPNKNCDQEGERRKDGEEGKQEARFRFG